MTPEKKSPMQGVEIWRNPKNRFVVFQNHYTADPKKRGDAYIEPIRASMPVAQFRQEFELVWESFIGMPVYQDWNKSIHGASKPISPQIGLPLLLGVDQGLHPAVVVCQLQENVLVVLKEYTAVNMGAERFSEQVKLSLRMDFPEWPELEEMLMGMDPTGFNRRDVDERTYAAVWNKAGFKPKPGENGWEKRRAAVENWLIKFRKGEPCFKVNLSECPILVEGFDGGYRYPDHSAQVEPTKIKPIKDKYGQPHDALQYILTLLISHSNIKRRKVPSPEYYVRNTDERRQD